MDTVMNEAIQEADRLGISGNENTPFILKRIRELTDGDTVKANEALVQANVQRGIEVAVELSRLEHNRDEFDHRCEIFDIIYLSYADECVRSVHLSKARVHCIQRSISLTR